MKQEIHVTKSSGERQLFSREKLIHSLKRSGVSDEVINEITSELESKLYDGMSTKKLYSRAHNMLRRLSKPGAARYRLKEAIMQLGPSGFPFEKFIARLFSETGYDTSTSRFMQGKCVRHEVDVVGRKDGKAILAECKYHNKRGVTVDVKVPLYVRARFDDIMNGNDPEFKSAGVDGYVVTNVRFTSEAISYATCAGLKLMSWDFPHQTSLRDYIDNTALYPLTCLTTLTRAEKEALLSSGAILVKDLLQNNGKARTLLGEVKYTKVEKEASDLCSKINDAWKPAERTEKTPSPDSERTRELQP